MSETQHTPGPWEVGFRSLDVVAPSPKGGTCKVCDIRGWGYLTGKGSGALGLSDAEAVAIQTANARLIAAAPEMMTALMQIAQRANESGTGEMRLLDTIYEMHRIATAALAKAAGA